MLVCFHTIWKSLWLTVVIWHDFLAILKICLNCGSTRVGKAKFVGTFSTFQDFNGRCLFFFSSFSLSWTESSKSCLFIYERGRMYLGRGGGEPCSDMKSSCFLRMDSGPKTWVQGMYVNFLTCRISLYSFTCTLLLFLSDLRLNSASSISHSLCRGCQEAI